MYLSIFLMSKDPKNVTKQLILLLHILIKKKIYVIRYVSYSYKKKDMNNKE